MEASDSSNRGTIMSSRFAITQLTVIAGAAVGGFLSQWLGAQTTYGVLGGGLLSLAVVTGFLARERPAMVSHAGSESA